MNPLSSSHLALPASTAARAAGPEAAAGTPWQAGRWWDGLDASSGAMIVAELSLGGAGQTAAEHAQHVLAHLLDDSNLR